MREGGYNIPVRLLMQKLTITEYLRVVCTLCWHSNLFFVAEATAAAVAFVVVGKLMTTWRRHFHVSANRLRFLILARKELTICIVRVTAYREK